MGGQLVEGLALREAVLREAARDIADLAIRGTPQDTGHTAGSWTASKDGDVAPSALGARDPRARAGQYTADAARAQIAGVVATFRLGEVLTIGNAATPITKGGTTAALAVWLNSGAIRPRDPSTPPGWLEAAKTQWPAILSAAAARVRRANARQPRSRRL